MQAACVGHDVFAIEPAIAQGQGRGIRSQLAIDDLIAIDFARM